jgi:hypothetical protein
MLKNNVRRQRRSFVQTPVIEALTLHTPAKRGLLCDDIFFVIAIYGTFFRGLASV